MLAETADASRELATGDARPRPGVIVVFSGSSALSLALPLDDAPLVIGRAGELGARLPDERLSRSHCTIAVSSGGWLVRDLGSRNGTFVDGAPVEGEIALVSPTVIRAADTLVLPCADVSAFPGVTTAGGLVAGPRMRDALAAVDRAAEGSETLLLAGESGTGKELAARRFHERGPHAGGPFVAVNCATIPEGVAERLLFGARRGAYSGATSDVAGHVQAADGGVLFLDEVGELDLLVQAKLLRVLETHQFLALGATQPTHVSVRVCAATHVQLRRAVADGRFRADLYHRITPPEVLMPALRGRLEEIPHHIAVELAAAGGLAPSARLVEACMLLPWPGNVRELRRQIREAASRATAEGEGRVRVEHLSPTAGQALEPTAATTKAAVAPRAYVHRAGQLTREALERALAEHGGNVTRAARSLGLQRTQLYRELERHSLPRPGKPR
jgi:DNA-binding NtrC family response regulator